MIAPQELRLGNLIYIPDTDQILPITAMNMDLGVWVNRSLGVLGFDQIEPIELTEYWLFKMGFDLLHSGKFRKVYDLLKDSRFGYSDNFGLANIESAVTFGCKDFTHIKYVHQIQNLYIALTREELTIKEQK